MIFNYIVGPLAALLVLLLLDRLRQIRWPLSLLGRLFGHLTRAVCRRWPSSRLCGFLSRRSKPPVAGEARPIYVVMYLLKIGWASWLVWDAVVGTIAWGQLMGVCGILAWVANTRCQWRHGPPAVVLSQHGGLDNRPRYVGLERRRDPLRQSAEL